MPLTEELSPRLELSWGFTGTRQDPEPIQKKWLLGLVINKVQNGLIREVHHGCCIGADEYFHRCVKNSVDLGLKNITLHPPTDRSREMEIDEWTMTNCMWYPRKPYLQRNRDIVQYSSRLLALPATMGPTRGSGTWYTIAKAQEMKRFVVICYPNGAIRSWNPETDEWEDYAA